VAEAFKEKLESQGVKPVIVSGDVDALGDDPIFSKPRRIRNFITKTQMRSRENADCLALENKKLLVCNKPDHRAGCTARKRSFLSDVPKPPVAKYNGEM
jgi:hypothetical protein